MKRNLATLTNTVYDVLIIGGGIYGACVAWEASLRGLTVGLVEKSDFGSATSANSLKTIHGGLRYLQNADFKRMRESIHERKTLMRIAPHLVHPLPVLIPTYGHGTKGKEALSIAMAINDLVSCDRNQLQDRQKHIPRGRVISRQQCERVIPGMKTEGLTGAAIFHDAQVYNSERLTLAFLKSATEAGAQIANYVAVNGFVQQDNCITGVQAEDVLSGDTFEIQAKTVVNTTGPWINQVLGLLKEGHPGSKTGLAQAMNLVTRPLFNDYAVGLSGSNRLFFVAPWRGKSMIGTWQGVNNQEPEMFKITEETIQGFIDQFNQVYPAAQLTREDVSMVHAGLLPCSGVDPKTGEPVMTKQYQIRDHAQDGFTGLISVQGVKYTTARDVAQKVVNYLFKSWGKKSPKSVSSVTPIYGGQIEDFTAFLNQAMVRKKSEGWTEETIRRLVYNYGSSYPDVLSYYMKKQSNASEIERAVLKAEVLHAIDQEMAQKLSDVVLRRTELGSAGNPDYEALKLCAETMGSVLGWSRVKIEQELHEVSQLNSIARPTVSSRV